MTASLANRPLHALQTWLQAVVTHPLGVAEGIASKTAQAAVPLDIADIESLIGRSHTLDSVERLAVYGNAYFARLLDCLADEFPTTKQVLGDDAFTALGMQYIHACPSQSYTLNSLGCRFPDYLRATRPEHVSHPSWPDFVIDLATLERTYSEVFDGPGIEFERQDSIGPPTRPVFGSTPSCEPLTPTALHTLTPSELIHIILVPAPCLRLLKLDFPAHEAITAARQGTEVPAFAPEPTFLVVTRRDFVVRRSTVTANEFTVLQALVNGEPLSLALQAGTLTAAEATMSFERWAQARWFIGFRKAVAARPNCSSGIHQS